jgi:hypothetical protein
MPGHATELCQSVAGGRQYQFTARIEQRQRVVVVRTLVAQEITQDCCPGDRILWSGQEAQGSLAGTDNGSVAPPFLDPALDLPGLQPGNADERLPGNLTRRIPVAFHDKPTAADTDNHQDGQQRPRQGHSGGGLRLAHTARAVHAAWQGITAVSVWPPSGGAIIYAAHPIHGSGLESEHGQSGKSVPHVHTLSCLGSPARMVRKPRIEYPARFTM